MQTNPSFSDRMHQSFRQSQELSNSRLLQSHPPLDFNRLSPEQQMTILAWSQKQQEELQSQQPLQQPVQPFMNMYQTQYQTINLAQSQHLQNSNVFLQQQQQMLDNYQMQVQTLVQPQVQDQQMQPSQYADPLNLPYQQGMQQETMKTTYDQNGLHEKWKQQWTQIINTMQPHQSLDEPFMPELYKYFEAGEQKMDPYLGEIYVLINKANPQYKLSLKVAVLDKYEVYVQEEKILQAKRLQFTHPNLINIHLIHTKKFVCLCCATFRICLLQDYIYDNLEDLRVSKHFSENDIWNILESITEALYMLHLKGIVHGHVSLNYILVSYLIDGTLIYKIVYRMQDQSLLDLQFSNQNVTQYLSPELYHSYLSNDRTSPVTWKADVFSLGISLIALMLGQNSSELNQLYTQTGFDEIRLGHILKQLSEAHSTKLLGVISQMVKVNMQQRYDWIQLAGRLSQIHHPQTNYTNLIFTQEVQLRMEQKLKLRNSNLTNLTNKSPIQSPSQSFYVQENLLRGGQKFATVLDIPTNQTTMVENRGKRKLQYPDGSKYVGEVFNGLRDGIGQYVSDRVQYDGCWKNDKYHGQGTLYEDGKLVYEGAFRMGMYEGYGKSKNPGPRYSDRELDYKDLSNLSAEWLTYQGDFKNGVFNGFGILELSNGERLTCVFRDGLPDGVGVYETRDRRRVNAQWDMGLLVRRI